jgi:hypothetical protein
MRVHDPPEKRALARAGVACDDQPRFRSERLLQTMAFGFAGYGMFLTMLEDGGRRPSSSIRGV